MTVRIIAACIIAAAYVIFCALLWRSHRRAAGRAGSTREGAASDTLIAFASQTGYAQKIAHQTARMLASAGSSARLVPLDGVDAEQLSVARQVLFVVSTTGEGDAPDAAASFVRESMGASSVLSQLRYGVLALGDREYDNFCAFGHRLDAWLKRQGATPWFDLVEVDNGDEVALRRWQQHLATLGGRPDIAGWETVRYERWRLVERVLLNPGSAGDPCFHLALAPESERLEWSAGDIAEIDPRNSTWNEGAMAHLPRREYSIASLPADGAVHLVVRQTRGPDGQPGVGSGWLTHEAAIGGEVALCIRSNVNFRAPSSPAPCIFIGNGTGIAGLRGLLKARIADGHYRNWLIFGERNARHDHFYAEELATYLRNGELAKLDRVFSRDQPARRYVQHRVLECAAEVKAWVEAGAYVYVCGSLAGMAPGVHAALETVLGVEVLKTLTRAGRYRRDVY